jgi:hypothetical protein
MPQKTNPFPVIEKGRKCSIFTLYQAEILLSREWDLNAICRNMLTKYCFILLFDLSGVDIWQPLTWDSRYVYDGPRVLRIKIHKGGSRKWHGL